MTTRLYAAIGDMSQIRPAHLAALGAYLRGPDGEDDLVAIGYSDIDAVDLTAWPLQALDTGTGREAFLAYQSRSLADRVCLLAYPEPGQAPGAAALLDRLAAMVEEARPGFTDAYRCLVVAQGHWGTSAELADNPEVRELAEVDALDPAAATLTAAAVRASCHRAAAAAVLRQETGPAMVTAREVAWAIQRRRADAEADSQFRSDLARYERARRRSDDLPAPQAVALAVAAASSDRFRGWLVDRILTGDEPIGLWCTAARLSAGTQRAVASALAALAAWRRGDPLAAPAIEAALDADDASALAWTVYHLLHSGTRPEHLDPAAATAVLGREATPTAA